MSKESEDYKQDTQSVLNGFVIGNFVASVFLAASMQTLFSAIHSLQITAHLPLISIPFSSSSYLLFDALIQVMTFQFVPTDGIDYGFHESDSWSEKFAWIGYESSNFIELIGSIGLFLLLFAIRGVIIIGF